MRPTIIALVFALFAASVSAQNAAIPATPAGRALRAWLDVLNGGDRARMQGFIDEYGWSQSVEVMLSFRDRTGGFDFVGVEHSAPERVEFVVEERASDTRAIGRLAVSGNPAKAIAWTLRAMPPGAEALGFEIDAAMRNDVIDGAVAKLRELYVFEEEAEVMAQSVESHRRDGDYDAITDGGEFASLLTTHMRDVSHDLHLRIDFRPFALPQLSDAVQGNPADDERFRSRLARINCGFERVEIMDGNVGYLKFNQFAPPPVCGATASAAMSFLQHVDALIVDMRENGGGDPAMVAYIATYLFDEPTHLNDLYNRAEDSTQQSWTLPYVPGGRLLEQPVFVLTSRRTFSGAEEFSYDLKSLGRATIVGETTGGGAHPVRGEPLGAQFTIGVPFARAINPVTKTNWEGTGVEPDVAVPADEALDRARELVAVQLADAR